MSVVTPRCEGDDTVRTSIIVEHAALGTGLPPDVSGGMPPRKERETMYQRILVAVDGSPTSRRALCEAIGLAKDQHAQLLLLHVLDESVLYPYPAPYTGVGTVLQSWRDGGRTILAEGAALAQQEGVPAETEQDTICGEQVAHAIVEAAKRWSADLIVIGTHGRHGLEHFLLGSVAECVARISPLPILLTRGGMSPD